MLRDDSNCFFTQHSGGLDDSPTTYEYPVLKLPEGKIIDGIGSGDAFIDTPATELVEDTSLCDAIPLAITAGTAAV